MNLHTQAQEAAKVAFKRMMDAATKTANLFTMLAQQETDPQKRSEYNTAAACWQKSAQTAYHHWSAL